MSNVGRKLVGKMKIAIIGTHGTGKTTLAYLLAAKAQEKGFSTKIVHEVARTCPFPLNENFDTDGAHWIISTQVKRELSCKAEKTQCIICDRSTIDPICYLKALNNPTFNYEGLQNFAEEWMKTYDYIIFVTPTGEELEFDGVRCMDNQFQYDVHEQFLKLLNLSDKRILGFRSTRIFVQDIRDLEFIFEDKK